MGQGTETLGLSAREELHPAHSRWGSVSPVPGEVCSPCHTLTAAWRDAGSHPAKLYSDSSLGETGRQQTSFQTIMFWGNLLCSHR